MPSSLEKRGPKSPWQAVALACSLVLAAGCANDARSKNDDPLTGGGRAIPERGADTASAPTPGADPALAAPRTNVPALP
ncbi:MAG TPA: hypothetical protein VKE94_08385, partial [Gemmataceae bacterium]|nr:hypothetical protein [Gemmataceae bacterium]